jgi:hypothetical protein
MVAASAAGGPVKVVVAFLDGRRVHGYVLDFSPVRDKCRVFPSEKATASEAEEIDLRKLKAIFFVKAFTDKEHQDPENPNEFVGAAHGRKIEVTFSDGERLMGTTEGYSPARLGFFFSPANARSNILRIFVVNANVTRVAWLASTPGPAH